MTLNSIFTNLHPKLNSMFLQVLIPVVYRNNTTRKIITRCRKYYYSLQVFRWLPKIKHESPSPKHISIRHYCQLKLDGATR